MVLSKWSYEELISLWSIIIQTSLMDELQIWTVPCRALDYICMG